MGGRVIDDLIERGYEVLSLDNRSSGRSDIEEIIADITDPSSIYFKGDLDGVVHCAGILESSHPTKDVLMNINYEGTKNIYLKALEHGAKRFVFMSSIMALGPHGRATSPMTEDLKPHPNEPYGRSKLLSESFLLDRAEKDDVIVSVIRPPVIYGEGMSTNSSAMRTFHSVKKGIIPMIDGGMHVFNLLYVGNLSHALVLALERNEKPRVFHVNEGPYTLKQAVESISRRIGIEKGYVGIPKPVFYIACRALDSIGHLMNGPPPLSMNKYRALTSDVWNMDHSRICKELGYRPVFTLEEGIDRTCTSLGF